MLIEMHFLEKLIGVQTSQCKFHFVINKPVKNGLVYIVQYYPGKSILKAFGTTKENS